MGKVKKQKPSPKQFDVGSHGGCEALLFEFRDNLTRFMKESDNDSADVPEPHIVRIAALTFDGALEYLRFHEPDFAIDSVQNLGLILMVSGSPVD